MRIFRRLKSIRISPTCTCAKPTIVFIQGRVRREAARAGDRSSKSKQGFSISRKAAASSEESPMKIAIGSDHAGFTYKEKIKKLLSDLGHDVTDFGTYSDEPVDYPLFIRPVAAAVAGGGTERGVGLGGARYGGGKGPHPGQR